MRKAKTFTTILMGAASALALCGCGGGGGGSTTQQASKSLPPAVAAALQRAAPVPATIVSANNSFGMQLLAQMRTTDTGKNVFISPTSVALCLEILYNGAAGTTQSAMAQTLGLGSLATADLNNDNAALQASLVSSDPSVQLNIANSFWYYKANNQILPSFVTTNTQYYGSQIGDLSGAPNNINAWVSAQTNGKITQVVGQNVTQDVAVLVNAVYFKGTWTTKFDPTLTTAANFTLANGSTVSCNLMHRNDMFAYYKGDQFQAVQIPYGGKRLSMVVFLPNAGVSLDSLLAEITPNNLSGWLPQFTTQLGLVALPRFTSTYSVDLKPVLTAMGMGIAFDPNNANFSNLGPGLFIDSAIHQSYLSVDESGTTAAGSTTVGVGATAAPSDTFNMTMDQPFVCAIIDSQTGDILFYGAIDNPAIQ